MTKKPTPLRTPASRENFAPCGGDKAFEYVEHSLKKFGALRGGDQNLIREEITSNAVHFNRLCSADYRGPKRSEIEGQLVGVMKEASLLRAALKNLHYVSLCWLTGDNDAIPPFHYRPAQRRRDPIAELSDYAWRGPDELRRNEAFVSALEAAFAPQILMVAQEIEKRQHRVASEKETAKERMNEAWTEQDQHAAEQEWFNVKPAFDRRLDLTEALASQLNSLSIVAQLALKEFKQQWPEAKGGNSDVLAVQSPQNWLATSCWGVIANFYGPKGFDLITQTPTGRFAEVVKNVAWYATGQFPEGEEFNASVKYAARQAKDLAKRSAERGEEFFAAYHLARGSSPA
jgi:hypothetical protein